MKRKTEHLMTEGEAIPTGTKVRVTKVIGSELLEVEKV